MIINVRGTHGSGKTTLVSKIMEAYSKKQTHHIADRNRPIGYALSSPVLKPLWVSGSYENATGGCDTIPKIEQIFDIVKLMSGKGFEVLYEGILAQHSTPRVLELKPLGLLVIVLNTPVEECIASVQKRRDERGETKPLNPDNIIREAKSVISAARRLKDAGVNVVSCSREEGARLVLDMLTRK